MKYKQKFCHQLSVNKKFKVEVNGEVLFVVAYLAKVSPLVSFFGLIDPISSTHFLFPKIGFQLCREVNKLSSQ
jgi:hypothetical protein